ncbi:MAG: FliI/YscN family ATPase [Planctomycetota bacterium]
MTAFASELQSLMSCDPVRITGRICRVAGLVVEAEGVPLPVGSSCMIQCRMDRKRQIEAEVVGFHDGRTLLVPSGETTGISPGDRVIYEGEQPGVRVAPDLLGRIVDGYGNPIDDKGPIHWCARMPLEGRRVAPLSRQRVDQPFSTGVRVIDGPLTCGRGQRMGIFAGSGVGKSVLMGMLARQSQAPVTVIGLIGERGREVREFVERDLGEEGLAKSVVVVATSDDPPVLRLRAARVATAIAEFFRDRGEDVLLLMDSVTRVAYAQRELGLSAYEPPTTKAFPPSVFTLLARLLERTGPAENGSITSFYTVLVEADDINDPIGDAVRGYLDGHIWLSRKLASRGHFPAVDVLESVSRVMKDVVTDAHKTCAQQLVADLSRYRDVEDLLQLGAYARGADPQTDESIARMPAIQQFLTQASEENADFASAAAGLAALYRKARAKQPARNAALPEVIDVAQPGEAQVAAEAAAGESTADNTVNAAASGEVTP